MHEKLIKQLRNQGHCKDCPYTVDCDSFDSCLMDLLAADAIEDLIKRLKRKEAELNAVVGEVWSIDLSRKYKRILEE